MQDVSSSDTPGATAEAAVEAELVRLRREVARLTAQARQLQASATVQAMRAGAQGALARADTDRATAAVEQIRNSLAWRITLPLRVATDLARGAPATGTPEAHAIRQALTSVVKGGRVARPARKASAPAAKPTLPAPPVSPALPPPGAVLVPCVLIIAELSLPQCAKYRVWQKQEHFARLGIPCRVVDWRDTEDCFSAAALATRIILYRVPGYRSMMRLIRTVHRLRVPVAWEVDDLIFDRTLFLQNRNVDTLEQDVRDGILSGVELYRRAMLACGNGIASTPYLARAMQEAGLDRVAVVENALDEDTLAIGARLRARPKVDRPGVLIAYGSGTKTHDADFRQAEPALVRILREHPHVRLRLMGELKLSASFDAFAARIERIPPAPYARYLELLADSDLSIAPLEPSLFNDAKSNIKFLESAILGVPAVCSPRAHFTDQVRHGQNGMLAEDDAAWFAALTALVTDPALRTRLGQAALADALHHYDPAAITRTQAAPLLAGGPVRRRARLRVMIVNIYYAPRSYGGATLVAEEMARRLHARGDVDVHVVTSLGPDATDLALARSDQDGIAVYALPAVERDGVAEFDNPSLAELFGHVLDAAQPDVVHLHSVQWLSASLAAAAAARQIPYVITLHDAWWLCARQFMVMGDGRYCFQTRIDLRVCAACLPGMRHLEHRAVLLRAALDGAALLLSPSQSHRQLYLANGIPPERIEVAPNGVRLPQGQPRRDYTGPLRFGYVGGNVEVKGYSIVKRAFEALRRGDWRLVLVDNTLNLGFSSMDADDWDVAGTLHIVPAYTQDELDTFFAEIDVLVFSSQWKESFGLTVREALARDVWVIATDGGGPAEAIVDGVNGTLLPLDGSHLPLLAALEALLADRARLVGWRNPHAHEIAGYQAQADALWATLTRVAAHTPPC